MHIDGIINMVHLRGGIQQVKLTSPLTARMISWSVVYADLIETIAKKVTSGCL